ncbi:hypothetical protein M501DRAFT_1001279 [Patellaria atrata CBS 101060]|uniref:Peroxin 26 n=1 Tax=Patellaria atrata CBS 101060 TaxID=1346257 RepID=A0A9P4VM82_9PEZI|nr:hypothetical protein M501DRAFT_1001279 [Patellaria atrata CBS 101060]
MSHTYEDSLSASHMLSSSISSLSASRHQASQIAKAYRQAAQLFLTRRLPEALSTIEPVISPQQQPNTTNGDIDGESTTTSPAPVAAASRGTRIKVWSFYLTFLNSVVELGPEEGKHAFGTAKWKSLVQKARDGSAWEDIVRDGYGGVEGDVDPEVVVNLATLLLTHSPTQKLTQQRLETYLSAVSHPTFDISAHMDSSRGSLPGRPSTHGASTPRDLNVRLKLLELYTLHVLPRNDEWDYAREFISMSEILDDERKEAFLLALHGLREENDHAALREEELRKQQQEQLEQRKREAEARRAEEKKMEEEKLRQEELKRRRAPVSPGKDSTGKMNGAPRTGQGRQQGTPSTPSRSSKAVKKNVSPPPGLYKRASTMFASLNTLIIDTATSLTNNPMALLRILFFILAFTLAFGRRDLRERIKRSLRDAWEKVRRTVGMGVKVSYI